MRLGPDWTLTAEVPQYAAELRSDGLIEGLEVQPLHHGALVDKRQHAHLGGSHDEITVGTDLEQVHLEQWQGGASGAAFSRNV